MTIIYVVLGCAVVLLFGLGVVTMKKQKDLQKKKGMLKNTDNIEVLDENRPLKFKEKPMIISSTVIEENLEMDDDE